MDDLIPVNQSTIQKIDKEYEENIVLGVVVNKIVNATFKGGITVNLKVGDDKISLSKEGNEIIKKYWLPVAKKDLICSILYSMTPIIIKTTQDENGRELTYPVVPMKGSFGFAFTIDEDGQPSYFVRKLINNSQNTGNEIWRNSLVLRSEKYECSSNGNLTSPVQVSMKSLRRIDNMWKMYMSSSYQLSRPPYIYDLPVDTQDDPNKTFLDHIVSSDFDTTGEGEKEYEMNEERQRKMEEAIKFSKEIGDHHEQDGALGEFCSTMLRKLNQSSEVDELDRNRKPWANAFFPPPGWKINSNFPKVQQPNGFLEVMRFINSQIINNFQLTDQISEGTSTRSQGGSSAFAQNQFNDLIKSNQTVVKDHMDMLLNTIYKNIGRIVTRGTIPLLDSLSEQDLSRDSVEDILSDIKIEMTFNDEPTFSTPEIIELFKSGLIPKEIAQQRILPKFNIDPDEVIEMQERQSRRQRQMNREDRQQQQQENIDAGQVAQQSEQEPPLEQSQQQQTEQVRSTNTAKDFNLHGKSVKSFDSGNNGSDDSLSRVENYKKRKFVKITNSINNSSINGTDNATIRTNNFNYLNQKMEDVSQHKKKRKLSIFGKKIIFKAIKKSFENHQQRRQKAVEEMDYIKEQIKKSKKYIEQDDSGENSDQEEETLKEMETENSNTEKKQESNQEENDQEESDQKESDQKENDQEENDQQENDQQESDQKESKQEENDQQENDQQENDQQENDQEENDQEQDDQQDNSSDINEKHKEKVIADDHENSNMQVDQNDSIETKDQNDSTKTKDQDDSTETKEQNNLTETDVDQEQINNKDSLLDNSKDNLNDKKHLKKNRKEAFLKTQTKRIEDVLNNFDDTDIIINEEDSEVLQEKHDNDIDINGQINKDGLAQAENVNAQSVETASLGK